MTGTIPMKKNLRRLFATPESSDLSHHLPRESYQAKIVAIHTLSIVILMVTMATTMQVLTAILILGAAHRQP